MLQLHAFEKTMPQCKKEEAASDYLAEENGLQGQIGYMTNDQPISHLE